MGAYFTVELLSGDRKSRYKNQKTVYYKIILCSMSCLAPHRAAMLNTFLSFFIFFC